MTTRNCYCTYCSQNFDFNQKLGEFTSFITKRTYNLKVEHNNLSPCKLDNVVYLLTCYNCGLQYVGITTNILARRVSNYRYKCKRRDFRQLVHKHYIYGDCSFNTDAKFNIIERVTESLLRNRENYWINELKTFYPHGLNVQKLKTKEAAAAAEAATRTIPPPPSTITVISTPIIPSSQFGYKDEEKEIVQKSRMTTATDEISKLSLSFSSSLILSPDQQQQQKQKTRKKRMNNKNEGEKM